MTENDLIRLVNRRLQSGWSEAEIKNGKIVSVKWEWHEAINAVVNLYKLNGWEVKKHVEISSSGKKVSLSFRNRKWLK